MNIYSSGLLCHQHINISLESLKRTGALKFEMFFKARVYVRLITSTLGLWGALNLYLFKNKSLLSAWIVWYRPRLICLYTRVVKLMKGILKDKNNEIY